MTDKKLCKAIIVRASYPFGPGMYDFLLSSSFKDIPHNGQLTWLYRTDHKYQFSYTSDVVRIIETLSATPRKEYLTSLNYAGYTVPSVAQFGQAILATAKSIYQSAPISSFASV